MKQDIEKLIDKEVEELIRLDEVWINIGNYSYISDVVSLRLKNKGYTDNQIKELKISISSRLKKEMLIIKGGL